MRLPQNSFIPPAFFGNYFCLIPNTNLAFVVISKNAVTFLKKVAYYNSTGKWEENFLQAHHLIGYTEKSSFLIPIAKMPEYEKENGKRVKFAIWRDPMERVLSTYKLFCLEKEFRTYFHFTGLFHDNSFDFFMKFMEFEWSKKYGETQDEHIRRQIDYYDAVDVDYIVPIGKMHGFLIDHNVQFIKELSNRTTVSFELSNKQYIQRIYDYYQEDYNIRCNY